MKRVEKTSREGERGFSPVEVLLAAAILSLLTVSMVGAVLFGEEGAALSGARNRASFLAEEGLEATRNIRDDDYANLTDGPHGLSTAGSQWSFSGTSDVTDIFSRVVTIATATESANRKDVTAALTWQQNLQRSGSTSLLTRMTNWRRVFGNWGSPSLQSSLNLAGNQAGRKVALSGNYAYVVRDGGTPDFAVVNVSAPATPTLAGSLTLSGNPTNIYILGNYAYVASDDNGAELQIIDITTPTTPSVVGSYDASGNADGMGVYVVGSSAYLVRAGNTDNFLVINVGTPSSPSLVGSTSLAGPEYEVFVDGSYAYVSSGDNSSELQVVSVSTPSAPALAASLNLSSNTDAETISGYAGTVFLGQTNGDVSAVEVTTPTSPTLADTYTGGNNIHDIAFGLSDGYMLIVKDVGTSEFEVVDVTTPASMTVLGSANLSTTQNGVVYDQERDRVYVVGADNSAEFMVIQPL